MVACRPVQQGVSPMCSPQPRQLVTFVFPYLLGGMGGRVNRVPCFNGLSPRETTCYAGIAAAGPGSVCAARSLPPRRGPLLPWVKTMRSRRGSGRSS